MSWTNLLSFYIWKKKKKNAQNIRQMLWFLVFYLMYEWALKHWKALFVQIRFVEKQCCVSTDE